MNPDDVVSRESIQALRKRPTIKDNKKANTVMNPLILCGSISISDLFHTWPFW